MVRRSLISFILILYAAVAMAAGKHKFTLVIDAGHGGHDVGAMGKFSKEKDINLRTALAFFVESRRTEVCGRKLARKDSLIDAEQALTAAMDYIRENIDAFGLAAESSPIYKKVMKEAARAQADAEAAHRREHRSHAHPRDGRLFTGFPLTGRFVTETS